MTFKNRYQQTFFDTILACMEILATCAMNLFMPSSRTKCRAVYRFVVLLVRFSNQNSDCVPGSLRRFYKGKKMAEVKNCTRDTNRIGRQYFRHALNICKNLHRLTAELLFCAFKLYL